MFLDAVPELRPYSTTRFPSPAMNTALRFLSLLVLLTITASPLAKADDTEKLLGTWKGRGFEVEGAVQITFKANGVFDLTFEDKDVPIQTSGTYVADTSSLPWKLTIVIKPPDGDTTTAKTVMALLSDKQLLIQKSGPDAPSPTRFTKDSVILDRVP